MAVALVVMVERSVRSNEEDEGWTDSVLLEAVEAVRAWNASVAMPAELIRLPTEEGPLLVAGAD